MRGRARKRKDRHRKKGLGEERGIVDRGLKKRCHVAQKEKMTKVKKYKKRQGERRGKRKIEKSRRSGKKKREKCRDREKERER